MLNVDYGSSDEEVVRQDVKENGVSNPPRNAAKQQQDYTPSAHQQSTSDLPVGPAPGPTAATPSSATNAPAPFASPTASAPASPYTQTRQITHSLTLPPLPNTAIPPSPPGSPPPSSSAKVSRFLALKKQGVHFNAKLASSTQLRNPSLLQNLMEFAGIEGDEQYATTLAVEKPVPDSGFPKWAHAEELVKAGREVEERKEKRRKEAGKVDFVSAVGADGGASGRSGSSTPSLRGGSAADRVMKGLNRERGKGSPMVLGQTQRKSRFDQTDEGGRSRSRSPKRRRDR